MFRQFWIALGVVLLVSSCGADPTPTGSSARVFGRLVAVSLMSASIQNLDFLTGDEATTAYEEDTGRTGGPPNPFWIRDPHTTEVLAIAPSVSIVALACNADGAPSPVPIELARLLDVFAKPASIDSCWTDYFWFELHDGKVTQIQAQYVP